MNKPRTLKSKYVADEYIARLMTLHETARAQPINSETRSTYYNQEQALRVEIVELITLGLDHRAKHNPGATSTDLKLQKFCEAMIVPGNGGG